MDREVWACPVCYSDLSERDGEIKCLSEARSFRRIDGLPVLIRPEQEPLLDDAERNASAWRRTRWATPANAILELPYIRRAGWKQKARSFRRLQELLGAPRTRRVVDIGAGTGWLSYRLAEGGFRCFATDISMDPNVGLGAARLFDETPNSFERAIATLDCWPFRSGSVDIAICNASLHYLADPSATVAEAARVLRTSGVFVVMNSPVHTDVGSADRASRSFRADLQILGSGLNFLKGHHHFVRSDLEACLREQFLDVRRHDPDYGFWFRATRKAKSAVLGMELASFPIYEARTQRPASESARRNSI